MYDISSNVLSKTGYSVDQLNGVLVKGLSGMGQIFKNIEDNYGINALFAIAHSALESAWGTSIIAMSKNNIYGIAAFDKDPGQAYSFSSYEACADYYGKFLLDQYLNPAGSWYSGGTTIHNVFVNYSTSHDVEASNICVIMNQLANKVNTNVAPVVIPVAKPDSASEYTVKSGDNLSAIASKYGITDWNRLYLNNKALIGDNPNLIYPGQVLAIPAPDSTPSYKVDYRTYTVQSGDCLSAIAQNELGDWSKYTDIANLNGIGAPSYLIYPGQVLRLPI